MRLEQFYPVPGQSADARAGALQAAPKSSGARKSRRTRAPGSSSNPTSKRLLTRIGAQSTRARSMPAAPPPPRPPPASPSATRRNRKRWSTTRWADRRSEADARRNDRCPDQVPTLGESVTEATVSTWFKKPGDAVTQDEMLCELETDKVSVEVPAPAAGVLRRNPRHGRRHRRPPAPGSIATDGGGAAGAAGRRARGRSRRRTPVAARTRRRERRRGRPRRPRSRWPSAASTPATVTGTGRDGRVMKEDVAPRAAAARARPAAAAPAPAAEPPIPRAPGPRRGRRARGTGQDDPPAPDHRPPAQGGAEHRRHADHLQRGRHVRRHGRCATSTRTCSRRSTA